MSRDQTNDQDPLTLFTQLVMPHSDVGRAVTSHDLGRIMLIEYKPSDESRQAESELADLADGGQKTFVGILMCPVSSRTIDPVQMPEAEHALGFLYDALTRILNSKTKPENNESVSHEVDNTSTLITDHQLTVLELLEEGLSAKSMAARLEVSIHTVNYHKRNLYRNLNVSSATEAIRRARESGLI